MENNNQLLSSPAPPSCHSSAASFTAELFGDNDSQPSATEIFASIFPPPSTVWSTTLGTSGISAENIAKNTANANSGAMNTERRSIFQERIEPCPLSSSIYYGGQEDMYIRSSDPISKSYYKFKKEGVKEDPNHLHSATRGNWWQGSLYY